MKSVLVAATGAVMMMTLGVSSSAEAALINFSAAVFGKVTYTGSSLDKSSAINLDGSALIVGETAVDDASGLAHFGTVKIAPSNIVYGSGTGTGTLPGSGVVKSWVGTIGAAAGDEFTETLTTVDSIDRLTPNAITVRLSGTVSDTAGNFVDTPIFLILSASQVGGPGTAMNVLFTDTSVVAGVPETSTWAMMALGFVGLGYTVSRRRKTAPAALSA